MFLTYFRRHTNLIKKNEATKQKIKERDQKLLEKSSLMRMKAEMEK